MRVGLGANVGRTNVAENISALWTFAHANGISLDDIIERTAAAGVTIDGLLVRDAGIPESAVTAHEAALVIGAASIAAVDEAVVTAHEAALAIVLAQLTDGGNLTQDDVAEVITALWEFADANGIKIDVITERTAAAGVTIDGLQLKDLALWALGFVASGTRAYTSNVSGDSEPRFTRVADGQMQWGDGTNPLDVILKRDAANELGTPDDFNVGGVLDLGGDLELSERTVVLGAGANNDIATGTETVQRLDADTNGANLITGFAGGRAGRMILALNIGLTDSPTLSHEDAASVAVNRLLLPLEANRTLSTSGGAWFLYDGTVSRWRMVRTI